MNKLRLELPDDILRIIKEYSMPITRHDWRSLHKMTQNQFIRDYNIEFMTRYRNELRFQRMHNNLGFTTRYLRNKIFEDDYYVHFIAHYYNG